MENKKILQERYFVKKAFFWSQDQKIIVCVINKAWKCHKQFSQKSHLFRIKLTIFAVSNWYFYSLKYKYNMVQIKNWNEIDNV